MFDATGAYAAILVLVIMSVGLTELLTLIETRMGRRTGLSDASAQQRRQPVFLSKGFSVGMWKSTKSRTLRVTTVRL